MGIQPRFLQGWQEDDHATSGVPLGGVVARYLSRPEGERQFHCMVVAAHRGDGITTAGSQAEQHARKIVGVRSVARMTGDDRARLAIRDVVSPVAVVRAAVRAGVDPGLPVRRRSWLAALGAVVAFLLAAGLSLLTTATANGTLTADDTRRALTNPWYLLGAVLAGAAVIATERLLHLRSGVTDERLERIARAAAAKQAADQVPPEQRQFVALLAAALLAQRGRRCLIVEDYARLDIVTQSVIRQALETVSADCRELWIVLESTTLSIDPKARSATLIGDLGRYVLSKRQLNPAGPADAPALGSRSTLLFELKHLTDDQRRRLTEDEVRAGRSANASYVIVKDILGADASKAERDAFKRTWPPRDVRADIALHEALALLYLLSISTLPGRPAAFPLDGLPSELSAGGAQRAVLQQLLRTRPTQYTIQRRLERTLRIFARFVTEDRSALPAVLRLSPAVQDVLMPQNRAYDLPAADLVHLFWAPYRFHQGPLDRVKGLEDQAWHLHEAADPSTVGSPRVAKAFAMALLAVIDACVNLSRLPAAAELLDRAYELHAEPAFPLDAVALRQRTRALYAVSPEPALLTRAAASVSTGESAADLLVELFEQATPGARDLVRLLAVDEPLTTDLRLHAVWLALSLQPLTEATPRDLPLARAVVAAHLALPLLTQRALDEAEAQLTAANAGERSAAALKAVANALWCLALADETLTGPILSRIDTAGMPVRPDPAVALSPEEWSEWTRAVDYFVADGLEHGLHLFRAKPTVGMNYAYETARSELLIVIIAAAIRIRLRWTGLQRAREKRLDLVILDGCRELGLEVPPAPSTIAGRLSPRTLRSVAESVAARMSSMQTTWTKLEYPRAAAVLSARRVQFLAGLPGTGWRDDPAALRDRASHDLLGLLVNCAAAADTSNHPSVRAEIVASAVGRQLVDGQADEAFAAQLCLLTIQLSSSYDSVDTRSQLRYLTDAPSNRGSATRLDALLAAVEEDKDLDRVYTSLINAANTAAESPHDGDERERAIIHAMRLRTGRVTNPAVARALRAQLDAYELARLIHRGQSPNIDATLDAWQDRKTLPRYAFVLYLLALSQNTAIPERLRREAVAVLNDPHTYQSETGILLLANYMASAQQAHRVTMTAAESADLVVILRESAHRVGKPSPLPLKAAIETLHHLFRLDPENRLYYRAPLLDLNRNILILLHEQQLRDLLAGQRYGDLLRAYLQMFGRFLPAAEASGNGQITAFIDSRRQTLNLAFTRALFDQDEQSQASIGPLTYSALLQVLNLLAAVPDMPRDMADLLTQQRKLLEQSNSHA